MPSPLGSRNCRASPWQPVTRARQGSGLAGGPRGGSGGRGASGFSRGPRRRLGERTGGMEMGPGLRRWALPALALTWAALASAGEQPAHLSSEVFFCQKGSPNYGLARTLDDDLLFWYDFPHSSWRSRLPDFQPETQLSEAQIKARKKVCDAVLPFLTRFSDDNVQIQFPEATGIPQVDIFTLRPLVLGQPNVLVCSARNIFPPVARIRWAFHGRELTQGVQSTPVFPIQELDFQVFSYVEVTPQEGDIYSCTVKGLGGKFDTMAYWVPKDPVASKLLENVLCGLAVAVGALFIIVGVVLLALSFRFRSSD